MTSTPRDPERSDDAGESRLADLEFKLAFLERELGTWKDAVDDLHARLERTEAELRKTLRELREGTDGDPFYAGGTSEATDDAADDSGPTGDSGDSAGS
jgi:uncharacterized coiled-coil protein SlyX